MAKRSRLSELVQAHELLQPEACRVQTVVWAQTGKRGGHTDMPAPNSLPLVDKQDDCNSHREGGLDRLKFIRV